MIPELKPILDRAASVSVLLTQSGDKCTAILMVKPKEGEDPLPPVQVVASIDDIDDEVSMAFNEVSEAYASTADQIATFKKAAEASAESAKKKAAPTAKAAPVKKAATKKVAKKVTKPAPAKVEPAKVEAQPETDAETEAAMLLLFPNGI
tara:strand:- start:486 stop:935 length:450 start_codon:yes stop_codon:yes gene_type:complete